MAEQEGSSPLFAIFFLSIYSLLLIPLTIYRLCNAASSENVVKPWEAAQKRKPSATIKFLRRLSQPSNLLLLLGWIVWGVLVWYVQLSAKDLTPFDPFEILQVPRDASKSDISRAYRVLSLQYHPDKNPDPAAGKYFAEFITKAYKALTDETARKNYEQYGHPDGPQSIKLNVALPEWLINSDSKRAPLVLGGLVLFGILLPLGLAARYLLVSHKYAGPNQVMAETMDIFVRSKFAVKESQSLARIADTLVYAREFIDMPTPNEQGEGLEELRKTLLRLYPDLKEKTQFWKKRKSSIVKAHMLLLAHLGRADIPESLVADHRFVLTKSILLLEEMMKIAAFPRPPNMLGWLAPAMGSLEMMQCLTQGVPTASRKALGQSSKAGGEATLAQLPHVDGEVLKRLGRKRVRSLHDLLALPARERTSLLTSAGLGARQAEEVGTALVSVPTVALSEVACGLEGEEGEVMEGDILTCSARVTLHRPSHSLTAFRAPPKGSSVQAFAPLFPGPRQERWHFLLADTPKNALVALGSESLLAAEACGVVSALRSENGHAKEENASEDGDDSEELADNFTSENGAVEGKKGQQNGPLALTKTDGRRRRSSNKRLALPNGNSLQPAEPQLVELKFPSPPPGKYDFTLYCISDCWVGCDVATPVKLRVAEASRAEREGRAQRRRDAAEQDALLGSEEEDEGDEEADEDEGEGDYDSEETGTEESGSESSDDESLPALEEDGNASDTAPDDLEEKPLVTKQK